MERQVRSGFAEAADGTRLYWRTIGSGPVITCCNGVGVSTFFWKYLVEHYADQYTVLLWDYRSHGRSDRALDFATADLSIGRHAADLLVVLDAVGIAETLLVGHSMGCQVILEAWHMAPDRVLGLVPMLGSAGRTLDTFMGYAGSPRIFRLASRIVDRLGPDVHFLIRPVMESPLAWLVASRASLVDPYYARKEDMLPYMRHLATLDMRVFLHSVLACQDHDLWPLLPSIRLPVLVVAAERDSFTPVWLSKQMAAQIPDADFLLLADGSHAALIEQPDTIYHRMDRFIADRAVFGDQAPSRSRRVRAG